MPNYFQSANYCCTSMTLFETFSREIVLTETVDSLKIDYLETAEQDCD